MRPRVSTLGSVRPYNCSSVRNTFLNSWGWGVGLGWRRGWWREGDASDVWRDQTCFTANNLHVWTYLSWTPSLNSGRWRGWQARLRWSVNLHGNFPKWQDFVDCCVVLLSSKIAKQLFHINTVFCAILLYIWYVSFKKRNQRVQQNKGLISYHYELKSRIIFHSLTYSTLETKFEIRLGILDSRPSAFVDDLDAGVGIFVDDDVESLKRSGFRQGFGQLLRQLKRWEEQSLKKEGKRIGASASSVAAF